LKPIPCSLSKSFLRGVGPDEASVDPYLPASRLSPDAVVSRHAALQLFGKSYSIWNRYHYLTLSRRTPMGVRGHEFLQVLERAAVDVLYAPELTGGWEEIWHIREGWPPS